MKNPLKQDSRRIDVSSGSCCSRPCLGMTPTPSRTRLPAITRSSDSGTPATGRSDERQQDRYRLSGWPRPAQPTR
jgi:hypothetical protein